MWLREKGEEKHTAFRVLGRRGCKGVQSEKGSHLVEKNHTKAQRRSALTRAFLNLPRYRDTERRALYALSSHANGLHLRSAASAPLSSSPTPRAVLLLSPARFLQVGRPADPRFLLICPLIATQPLHRSVTTQ